MCGCQKPRSGSAPTSGHRNGGGRSTRSPAARSRQAQIDRENLILIKKLIALDNATHTTHTHSNSSSHRQKDRNQAAPQDRTLQSASSLTSTLKKKKQCSPDRARNTIVVPSSSMSSTNHVCPHPLKPDVPPAACHPLYTHGSATMTNNFADLNGTTMNFSKQSYSRKRTQDKIVGENRKLLQRILTARTAYSRVQCFEQEQERLKVLRNISRHATSSTSRLPQYQRLEHGSSEHVAGLRRHNSSSGELVHADAALGGSDLLSSSGIRLVHTTHLKTQRPLSASASSSSGPQRSSAAWASQGHPPQLLSSHPPGSESVVERLRAMTLDHPDVASDACEDDDASS